MEKNKYLKIWIFSVTFLLGLCFIGIGTEKGTSAATEETTEPTCPTGYEVKKYLATYDPVCCPTGSKKAYYNDGKAYCLSYSDEYDDNGAYISYSVKNVNNEKVCYADEVANTLILVKENVCPKGLGDSWITITDTCITVLGGLACDCYAPLSTCATEAKAATCPTGTDLTYDGCVATTGDSSSTTKNCYYSTEEGKYVSLTPEEAERVTEEGGTYTLEHSGECDGTEGGSSNKSCFKCSTGGVDPVYQENPPTTSTCVGTWQQTSKSDCNTTYYAYFKETSTASSTTKSCSISPDSTSTTCDVNVPSNPTDSNGKTFKGWTIDADTCNNLKTGSTIEISKSTTFYACWETKVTVTLDPTSEGTISGKSKGEKKELTCTYKGKSNCNIKENPTASKNGYEFAGWKSDGACIEDIRVPEYTKDVTYTACYSEPVEADKNVTVTYDANGGRIISGNSTEQCTIKSGQTSCTIRNFPTAEKDGYTFGGWGYNENCQSGHQVGTTATTTKSQTLFACWNEINNNENEPPIDEPSNDNNNNENDNNTNNNVEENPKTGQIAIFIVWIVAFCAIGYSIYYYKEIKEN